jgi:hypothetical protein
VAAGLAHSAAQPLKVNGSFGYVHGTEMAVPAYPGEHTIPVAGGSASRASISMSVMSYAGGAVVGSEQVIWARTGTAQHPRRSTHTTQRPPSPPSPRTGIGGSAAPRRPALARTTCSRTREN